MTTTVGRAALSGKDKHELARLLRAGIVGDERAYVAFLERITPMIRAFARRRITQGEIDPEDIVQEILLAIHLKRHTWVTDAPVMPWVYAIAQLKLVDAFRRRGRHIEVEIDDIADAVAQSGPETLSDRGITRILSLLSSIQQTVVEAISVEGCSIDNTAKRLRMSKMAVRVSLHRGLSAIAKRFGKR
jgi:RNA polymerase sigma-70 factor (ECF subfamily)